MTTNNNEDIAQLQANWEKIRAQLRIKMYLNADKLYQIWLEPLRVQQYSSETKDFVISAPNTSKADHHKNSAHVFLEEIVKFYPEASKVSFVVERDGGLVSSEKLPNDLFALSKNSTRKFLPTQIPLWEDSHIAVQHDIARSALFTANLRVGRAYYEDTTVASSSHLKVTFQGQELRQKDYDVYSAILSVGRGRLITSEDRYIRFNGRALVKELGWTNNNRSIQDLKSSILRLEACVVSIVRNINGKVYSYGEGGFIWEHHCILDNGEFSIDFNSSNDFAVVINPRLAQEIKPGNYSKVDKHIRRLLSPLAQWLLNYYSSHTVPFPVGIDLLHKLSGHQSKSFHFKEEMIRALKLLEEVGFLEKGSTINKAGVISVKKTKKGIAMNEVDDQASQ
jgi:hypothetical protein